jgi:hypothetical protein
MQRKAPDGYWFSTGPGVLSRSSITQWRFNLHPKKTQHPWFPQIGLSANISSMQHAGPKSALKIHKSTVIEIINSKLDIWMVVLHHDDIIYDIMQL